MISYSIKFNDDISMQFSNSNINENFQYNAFNDFYLNLDKTENLYFEVVLLLITNNKYLTT